MESKSGSSRIGTVYYTDSHGLSVAHLSFVSDVNFGYPRSKDHWLSIFDLRPLFIIHNLSGATSLLLRFKPIANELVKTAYVIHVFETFLLHHARCLTTPIA